MLICGKNQENINNIKTKLSKQFKMKDMGRIKTYIGIDVNYDSERNLMTLCQKRYIETLARRYRIENSKPFNTPMETGLQLKHVMVNSDTRYRSLIGALLYISTGTRSDISFSVNYLSRYQNSFDGTHFKYALRILQYLYATRDLKLTYTKENIGEIMDCLVDADWAGDSTDRISTSGYMIRVFGNVVSWKTHKQGSVNKSSTFAEYVALSEAVTSVIFVRGMLMEAFDVKLNTPIKIYEDNSGAIVIAKYGNFTKNSKYIQVHYHYVNEYCEKGIIDVVKIQSNDNIADIYTKPLCKVKFVKFREMLKLHE